MEKSIYITKALADKVETLTHAFLTHDGKEVLNPKPIAIPSGLKRPLTLQEQIQRLIKTEMSTQVQAQGHETYEQANDFDVPDDLPEPASHYELMDEEYLDTPEAPEATKTGGAAEVEPEPLVETETPAGVSEEPSE